GTLIFSNGSPIEVVGSVIVSNSVLTNVSGTATLSAISGTSPFQVASGAVYVNLGGAGNLYKFTAGTVVLGGSNSYGGLTIVSNGPWPVKGSLSPAPPAVSVYGVLGGTGMIARPVNIFAGGTLSPGPSLGTLTISNRTLTFSATSTAFMKLDASAATNDLVN